VVVLAAGEGKRLKSATPKVLHPVCGRPALWHVVRTALAARPDRLVLVVGHGADEVRDAVRSWDLPIEPVFVLQREQLGTGHAVLVSKRAVGRADDVLVANGDLDPVTPQDVRAIIRRHRRTGAAATIGSAFLDEPGGYGRVVREGKRVVGVVEGVDADPAIRAIHEVATNWIAFRREPLFATLPRVDRKNRQREYYLNRAITLMIEQGERVEAVVCDTGGTMGLNSRSGLASVSRVLRDRINATHLANGVTLIDPASTFIDVEVRIGRDTEIRPHTHLGGATSIGRDCTIGPSTEIRDSTVGNGSSVRFSLLDGSRIGRDVEVGPFARVRDGAVIEDGAVVGNFVEVKGSRVGRRAKAKHLAYVGDADIGAGANIGAGAVTVNYDGYRKHRTRVGDGASVGSDTMLVAPVTIGEGAVTGAGSVITKDVPPGALAVERAEQRTVPGYRQRKDAEHADRRRSRRAKGG
jgi:bifunctional UDP-N-acetylglucosamine pyrophosphorylase/glucosamine-1-phosphate N-acetyltransferase